jgi:hypothetical protein
MIGCLKYLIIELSISEQKFKIEIFIRRIFIYYILLVIIRNKNICFLSSAEFLTNLFDFYRFLANVLCYHNVRHFPWIVGSSIHINA